VKSAKKGVNCINEKNVVEYKKADILYLMNNIYSVF